MNDLHQQQEEWAAQQEEWDRHARLAVLRALIAIPQHRAEAPALAAALALIALAFAGLYLVLPA